MSEIKHTPGKWLRSHLTITAEMNGHVVANVGEPHHMLRGAEKREMLEECKANARLIAAAPELLREVEAIYTWLGDYTHEWPGRDKPEGQARLISMRRVIAVATGRTERDVQDDYGTRAARAKAEGA